MKLTQIKLNDLRGDRMKYPDMKYLLGGSGRIGGGSDDEWCCAYYHCIKDNQFTGYGGFFHGCYTPSVDDICNQADSLSAPQPCG